MANLPVAGFAWRVPLASADLSRVIVSNTQSSLVPADRDNGFNDIFEIGADNSVDLLSTGPQARNLAEDARLETATPGLAHIEFRTEERLTAKDRDFAADMYRRTAGRTVLVTTGSDRAGSAGWEARVDGNKRLGH